VAPAVALADQPDVSITGLATDVLSGNKLPIQYRIKPNGADPAAGKVTANIQLTGMSCGNGQCSGIVQVDPNGSDFQATLTAPKVDPGQTKSVNIKITVTIQGEDPKTTDQPVNVKGPDKPETVTSISGKIKDQNNKAVSGAAIAMSDSQGNTYQATSNGSGSYSFNSSDSKPIAPGNITIGALKQGFDSATIQIQGVAGKSVNANITLKGAAVTPSATPSAPASATATLPATDEATEEPTDEDSAAAADTENTASDQGSGGGSTMFIVVGGLLVAAGIGAIVLVLMRRKNNGGPGAEDDDPTAMPGGPGGGMGGMVPASQGRFNDATRIGGPMGAGRDATMIAPRGPVSNPMADAPTMLQRPVEDEFPDPYGVPIPQQGGYAGSAGGGWDNQADDYGNNAAPGGYAEPTQYGRPAGGAPAGTYGAAAAPAPATGAYGAEPRGGSYGAAQPDQRRYDEPTGMYRPEAAQDDEYDQRGGYGNPPAAAPQYGGGQYGGGPAAGGYDDRGGYDQGTGYAPQAPAAGGTYGAAAVPPAGGAGQYGGPQYGGGYDDRAPGYDDQAGYDQRGGYGAAPAAPAVGGYDQDGGYGGGYEPGGGYGEQPGYDQRGGYGDQPPPPRRGQPRPQEPSQPGQRRGEWNN